MPTTITVAEKTRRRLAAYKRGGMTFDEVLNLLMDRVQIEDVAVEQIAEHYRRLADADFLSADAFRAKVARRKRASK